jgi:hypothetical protein
MLLLNEFLLLLFISLRLSLGTFGYTLVILNGFRIRLTSNNEVTDDGTGKIKVNMSMCLLKHHAMKTYKGMEV